MVWTAHGMKPVVQPWRMAKVAPARVRVELLIFLSLMTTAQEGNLLRSEAELKLDLVSRLSLH